MIDWPHVNSEYHRILQELSANEPIQTWSIKPKGLLTTKHKTKYGMADINGFIHINIAFVGTSSYLLLDATLRHEFAHLYVGLEQKHNATFRKQERQFNADFRQVANHEHKQVISNIGCKYHLFATFKSGERVFLKKVQRKHRKYTEYKPTVFRYLSIKGQKVVSFQYETSD